MSDVANNGSAWTIVHNKREEKRQQRFQKKKEKFRITIRLREIDDRFDFLMQCDLEDRAKAEAEGRRYIADDSEAHHLSIEQNLLMHRIATQDFSELLESDS